MNWIKWTKGFANKPKVLRLAHLWKCSPCEAAACCMIIWEWADDISVDGHVDAPVDACVDLLFHATGKKDAFAGFEAVGWLTKTEQGICFPDFDVHNGKSAKLRALHSERQRKWRKNVDAPVDAPVDGGVDKEASTRVEKSSSILQGTQPKLEEVLKLADLRGWVKDWAKSWWNSMEACGWVDSKGRSVQKWEPLLTNYLSACRGNEQKDKQRNGSGNGKPQKNDPYPGDPMPSYSAPKEVMAAWLRRHVQ
jgi:hypothetical protein